MAEIKKYQSKNPVITRSGLISPKQIKEFAVGVLPDSWCQGTNQPGFERKEWTEESTTLIPLIEKLENELRDQFWVFDKEYDPKLDERIRIVFWFDN